MDVACNTCLYSGYRSLQRVFGMSEIAKEMEKPQLQYLGPEKMRQALEFQAFKIQYFPGFIKQKNLLPCVLFSPSFP